MSQHRLDNVSHRIGAKDPNKGACDEGEIGITNFDADDAQKGVAQENYEFSYPVICCVVIGMSQGISVAAIIGPVTSVELPIEPTIDWRVGSFEERNIYCSVVIRYDHWSVSLLVHVALDRKILSF